VAMKSTRGISCRRSSATAPLRRAEGCRDFGADQVHLGGIGRLFERASPKMIHRPSGDGRGLLITPRRGQLRAVPPVAVDRADDRPLSEAPG